MNIKESIAYFKQVLPQEAPVELELSHDNSPYSVSFSKDIHIFFLFDASDHFEIVLNRHIEESGISEDELLEIGIKNLEEIEFDKIEISKHEEVLYFHGSQNFEASMLLIDLLWSHSLSEHCPNGYVAAIPARDVLAVCDLKNQKGIEKLKEIIDSVWPDGDHLLSNKLFVKNETQWNYFQ
jgi:uncharacterized protein YtpQ (UPF0354 family)